MDESVLVHVTHVQEHYNGIAFVCQWFGYMVDLPKTKPKTVKVNEEVKNLTCANRHVQQKIKVYHKVTFSFHHNIHP